MRVIHSIDRNVGRVLKYLEENGLMENTMIVYTSDQGFYMGEHGWFDKRFMYEESFRTPCWSVCREERKVMLMRWCKILIMVLLYWTLQGGGTGRYAWSFFLAFAEGGEVPDWRKSLYYHFYEYPAEHAVPPPLWCTYRTL